MKKLIAISAFSALLIGCADSGDYGQGSAASSEEGTSTTVATPPPVVTEPGVAPDPATRSEIDRAESAYPTPSPSKPAPPEGTSEAPSEPPSVPQSQNEQGPQTTPEPVTGDDANPDLVNPRRA